MFYDNRVPWTGDFRTLLHPDDIQADGTGEEICNRITFTRCAAIPGPPIAGTTGGQGFFIAGGAPQNAILLEHCIGYGSLNRCGFFLKVGGAVKPRAVNCSTFGFTRGAPLPSGGTGADIVNSLIGYNFDDNCNLIGTVAVGISGNPLTVFQGTSPWLFDSYVPQPAHAAKGATQLISLVQARYAALP